MSRAELDAQKTRLESIKARSKIHAVDLNLSLDYGEVADALVALCERYLAGRGPALSPEDAGTFYTQERQLQWTAEHQ